MATFVSNVLPQEVLLAILFEYQAAHNGKSPRMAMLYWQFAAEYIYKAAHTPTAVKCFDWKDELVYKHKAAILAACPELANDTQSILYKPFEN